MELSAPRATGMLQKEQELPSSDGGERAPKKDSLEWISNSRTTKNSHKRWKCTNDTNERKTYGVI